MKYGCIHPSPESLAAAPACIIGATAPTHCDRTNILADWTATGIRDYRNGSIIGADTPQPEFNNCVIAALIHAYQGTARVFSAALPDAPDFEVFALFAGAAGIAWPATDAELAAIPGLDPVTALQYTVRNGLRVDSQTLLVPRPGRVDVADAGAVSAAIDAAGGLYAAVRLYQADEDAIASGRRLVLGTRGELVGGHMLLPFDFPAGFGPAQDVRIVTYDGVLVGSVEWLMDRLVCGFALHWTPPVMPPSMSVVDLAAVVGWAG